jgi:hypothetical protein
MRTTINATGLTWYYVYVTLSGMQLGLLAPPPDTEQHRWNAVAPSIRLSRGILFDTVPRINTLYRPSVAHRTRRHREAKHVWL